MQRSLWRTESSFLVELDTHADAYHARFLDAIPEQARIKIVDEFDRAVWSWRHPVRAIEARRASISAPPDSYESMHEVARHTLHSSEMLRTAIVVVESMLEESGPSSASSDSVTAAKAQRNLKFHVSRLRSLLRRSQALEARLRNEINLVCGVAQCARMAADRGRRLSTSTHGTTARSRAASPKQHNAMDE